MGWETAALLFGSFAIMLVLDFPVALSLGVSSTLTIIVFGLVPLEFLPQILFGTADSFTLLAIPFFIFAGIVLGHTSISQRLIDLAACIVGNMPGGLGVVGIVAAVFFAGISGSGPADVAALGLVLIPAMIRNGYGLGFSAALTAASGGIGIIVPPSIALIIYGFIAEVSIPKLFLAGIIPGILVALSLSIATVAGAYSAGLHRKKTPRPDMTVAVAFRRAFWGLMAPVIILGGIYGGVFTPTEAAAVAVVYSIFIDMVIYRSMTFRGLIDAAAEAGVMSSVIMAIVATASIFAWILNIEGIASGAAAFMVATIKSRWLLLIGINLILIAAGLFLDAISIFYIFLPVLLPVIRVIGVIMTVNLAIGQVTPPVGVNLVTASGVSGADLRTVSRASLPFIACECLALLIITFIPQLSLFLPDLF